jgi:DNA-binding NtrC family response regulator
MSGGGDRQRLLLVEDDKLVRETIALMLEDVFDVAAIDRASAALAWLHDRTHAAPVVILLDCLLPEGTPAALLSAADSLRIPVVLISGDPRQSEAHLPGRRFLMKPFSRGRVLEAIEGALA